ncbi:MAG: hypothetical protein UZ07_CHB004002820, partial [Chlorobi bacterium OLB7]
HPPGSIRNARNSSQASNHANSNRRVRSSNGTRGSNARSQMRSNARKLHPLRQRSLLSRKNACWQTLHNLRNQHPKNLPQATQPMLRRKGKRRNAAVAAVAVGKATMNSHQLQQRRGMPRRTLPLLFR